jgi:deoxyribodipyrimidine photo-lyase
MKIKHQVVIFWFRRDLRLDDNPGLFHALNSPDPVLPVFIFDTEILNDLEAKADPRVDFIHQQIQILNQNAQKHHSGIRTFHTTPLEAFNQLTEEFSIKAVFANKDYEPYGIKRDASIRQYLKDKDIPFFAYKDHVIFEENEILSNAGSFFKVFTPYKKTWLNKLSEYHYQNFSSENHLTNLYKTNPITIPTLAALGFTTSDTPTPPLVIHETIIKNYHHTRDFPAENGTTRLGIHLRFGTLSIRKAVKKALKLNPTWLNELIWREFFIMILFHNPHVVNHAFKPSYDTLPWVNNEEHFKKWCMGLTGYPIVDAGMRELSATGYMHNRVRMITASFLSKHLLIDWRWGEAWFASKLLDYELASNNGNWQWAASTGTDAQPYFRVFNPFTQAEKFDKERKYIKKWIPELETNQYPEPIVDHKTARDKAIAFFKQNLP